MKLQGFTMVENTPVFDGLDTWDAVQRFFQISHAEAIHLFHVRYSDPKERYSEYYGSAKENTRAGVRNRLRKFLETKKVVK